MQNEDEVDPGREEAVERARGVVRMRLGSELASKATDDFCLVSASPPGLALEGGHLSTHTVGADSSVIEFSPPEGPTFLDQLTDRSEFRDVLHALDRLLRAGAPREVVPTSAKFRQVFIEGARSRAYDEIGEAYSRLERLGSLIPDPSSTVAESTRSANRICWLNHTMSTRASHYAIAEIAGDPHIHKVDIPQRLVPEGLGPKGQARVSYQPAQDTIGLPAFLDAQGALSGAGVNVALIDTEVAAHHPALSGRVVQRKNLTSEPWGNPADHGTAVAAIIGANHSEHVGMAPGVEIYNYKVFATSRVAHGTDFDGALALQNALEDGMDLANCSWGSGWASDGPTRLTRAVDQAWANGLTVVKSAGNLGARGRETMTSPAEAQGVIVVGATGIDGRRIAPYSSRGPALGKPGPDLVAPGGDTSGRLSLAAASGGFDFADQGTSYSTAYVSGLIALMLEDNPTLLPDDIRELLRNSALGLNGVDQATGGQGLLQAPLV